MSWPPDNIGLFFRNFESVGQYHDHWALVVLSAPDNFLSDDDAPVDQVEALKEAFDVLKSGFVFVERKIKDERKLHILREMIEMSYEAYSTGNDMAGAHILQECEGMIWTSRAQRVKYAVAAEIRAFGEAVTYAGVKVSPYPYEGTAQDMGSAQAVLYHAAEARCLEYFSRREDFKPFVLVSDVAGAVRELKHRSWKAAQTEIRDLVTRGLIQGFVRAEVSVSGMSGVLIHTVEVTGHSQLSVRCLVNNYVCDSRVFLVDEPCVLASENVLAGE